MKYLILALIFCGCGNIALWECEKAEPDHEFARVVEFSDGHICGQIFKEVTLSQRKIDSLRKSKVRLESMEPHFEETDTLVIDGDKLPNYDTMVIKLLSYPPQYDTVLVTRTDSGIIFKNFK